MKTGNYLRSLLLGGSLFAMVSSARAAVWASWDSMVSTSVPQGANMTVNGWGGDSQTNGPGPGFVANVYVDGSFKTQVPMTVYRPDLQSSHGSGWAYAGFSATFSTTGLSVGNHTIDIWIGGGPSGWVHKTVPYVQGTGTFTVTPASNPPTGSVSGSTNGITAWGGSYQFHPGSNLSSYGWNVLYNGGLLGNNFYANSQNIMWGYGSGPGTYKFSVNMSGPGGGASTNTITTITEVPRLHVDAVNGAPPNSFSLYQGQAITASGWALDYQNGAPMSVRLFVDGIERSGAVSNGQYRGDVHNASVSYGWSPGNNVTYSGWTANFSSGSLSTGSHSMFLRVTDSFGYTSNSPNYNFTVNPLSGQPAVSSAHATIGVGQTWTPAYYGGAGSGNWQFVVGGQSNWPTNGATGSAFPTDANIQTSWIPPTPGTYEFWVRKLGDATHAMSNQAGPYTLTANASNQATVSLSASSTSITAGQSVTFTASGGSGTKTYTWGGSASGTGTSKTVAFPNTGTYQVTVYNPANGNYGQSNTATVTVNVGVTGQAAVNVSASSTSITAGQSVTFTASGGSGTKTYTWGGSASGTGTSKTVTFPNTGTYQVTVYNPANGNYGQSNTATASIAVGVAGSGTGLTGAYYPNRYLTGSATVTRTDATVDFDWGTGSPAGGIGADNFSVRWLGEIQAPLSGIYTFTTTSDDGIRLWVNNQLLLENWTDHGPTNNSGVITLTAGQKYPIKIEYYENASGAVAKLLWQYPGVSQQVVPTTYLYPASAGTGAPSVPTNLNFTNVTSSSFSLNWNASSGGTVPISYEVRKGSATYQSNITTTSCWISGLTPGEAATYTVRAKSADGIWSGWSNGLMVASESSPPVGVGTGETFWVDLPWYGASGGDGIMDEVYGGGTERFNYSVSRWYSNWQPPSDVWINLYFAKLDLLQFLQVGSIFYHRGDSPYDGGGPSPDPLIYLDFSLEFRWDSWIYEELLFGNYETDYDVEFMIDLPDSAWWSIYEDRSPYDEVDFDDWEPLQSGNGHQAGPESLISIYLMGSTRLQNSKFFLVEHGKPLGSITVELGGQTLVLNADGSLSGFGLPAGMNFAGANSFVRFEIDSLVIEVVTELAVNVLKAAGVTVPIGTPVTLSNGTTILLDAAGNVEVVTPGGSVVKGNIHTKGGSIVGPSASGVPGAGWGIEVLPNGTTRIIAPVGASAATQVLVRAINAAGKVLQEGAGAVWVLKDILGNTSSIPVGSGSLQVGVNSSGAVQLGVQVGEKPPVWFYFGKPVMRPDTDWSGDIGEFEDTSVSRRYILVPNEGDENAAIPGDDAANLVVDGQADVDDFHPVMLDLRAMLVNYPEGGDYSYRLWHAESALNFVYTRLKRSTAFDYLTDTSATYGPSRNQPVSSATVVPITAVGVDLNTDFLRDIREQDKGVILVEAKHWTEQPLVLDVLDGNDLLDRVYLHIGKMGLSVDANRDGNVDFGEIASSATPFRFWINNDDDHVSTFGGSDDQDRVPVQQADWSNHLIDCQRDLEDFSRMWIYIDGIHEKLKSAELFAGLRWSNISGTPAIKVFRHSESDGGTGYLTDSAIAYQEYADGGSADVLPLTDISGQNNDYLVEGSAPYVLPSSFFSGLAQGGAGAHILFEGCKGGVKRRVHCLLI